VSVIPTLEDVSDLNREIQVKSMLLDLISEIDPGTKRGLQLSERGTKVAKRMIELDLPPYVVPPFTDDQVKLLREVLSLLVALRKEGRDHSDDLFLHLGADVIRLDEAICGDGSDAQRPPRPGTYWRDE
jgi:hypothetical protein